MELLLAIVAIIFGAGMVAGYHIPRRMKPQDIVREYEAMRTGSRIPGVPSERRIDLADFYDRHIRGGEPMPVNPTPVKRANWNQFSREA